MAQSAVNGARRGGVRRAEKQDRRRKRKAGQRAAAGAVAVAAATTLGFGQTVGAGHAEAAVADDIVNSIVDGAGAVAGTWNIDVCATGGTKGSANCEDATKLGVAVVLPDEISVIPSSANTAHGSAVVKGSGYEFALAGREGKATAIAYLPVSLATAGATDGRTAWSFAVLGMANAWTTDATDVTAWHNGLRLTSIPGVKSVGCYGGLTAAYAEGVGACSNVLGTFDFRYSELDASKHKLSTPEVQFALTDPTAVLSDPAGVFADVISDLLEGETPTLSKDFTRLTVGGDRTDAYGLPVLFTLTSDYGTQAPIVVHWLGSSVTFNPTVTVNGKVKPNHLGLPVVTLADVDTAQLLPTVDIPEITFPFGVPSLGPFDGSTSAVSRSTASSSVSALRANASETIAPADTDTDTTAASSTADAPRATTETDTATKQVDATSVPKSTAVAAQRDSRDSSASGYVGRHRSLDDYVGKHRSTDGTGSPAGTASNGVASTEGATDTTDTHTHDTGTSSESAHSTDNAASSQ
ncbi:MULTISPECIES: hypothetical protein [Gordonia]|uniref:hypothetical protein n=1 Tax=Gordonia TaxID=2053 RepID=UPI00257D5883|nr:MULTISPECIES: hypothetical protein [Gordonia]